MNGAQSYAIDINHAPPQTRIPFYYPPTQGPPLATAEFHWMIAIQTFGGSASLLLLLPWSRWDAGSQALEQAREQLYKISSRRFHGRRMSMLCTKTNVGTARVKHIMTDTVDPDVHFRVNLHEYEHDALLTEIYDNQGLLFSHSAHLADTCYRLINPTNIDDCRGQRVIVLRRVLDKQKVAWLLISLLLVSPALGVIIGSVSHRADVGVAVAVGIFALASILQGLAAWFER